ncbi:MAG: hypothetical protein GF353_21675 [Candidatus Lokiarchaeota archaeon]|nr:hypothetical protein [Candidatus Lokiarchaeota archaeon]
MEQYKQKISEIKNFDKNHLDHINNIIGKLEKLLGKKRRLMYSDIINFIIREGYKDELADQIILWCNYKIRFEDPFIKTE